MRTRIAAAVGIAALLGAAAVVAQGTRNKITGAVNAKGRPIANAVVRHVGDLAEVQIARTDSKGRFEFPNGLPGVVTVAERGYGTAKRSWPPREGTELLFDLKPPSVVSGRLVDMGTQRGVDGSVTVEVLNTLNLVSAHAQVSGAFTFVDLPPGPAVVHAYANGFGPYYGEMTVEAGKQHTVSIGLRLEARASGRVVGADGKPVPGASVNVGYSRSTPGAGTLASHARGTAIVREDGLFRIGGLAPDTPVALQAEIDGRVSNTVTITVEQGAEQRDIILRIP